MKIHTNNKKIRIMGTTTERMRQKYCGWRTFPNLQVYRWVGMYVKHNNIYRRCIL